MTLRQIKWHKKMAARIIRVGLPTGIQNMVISFSNVLVQASVNSYGAAAMAGFAAYMKIDGFNILPVSSISMAATTFVGQNYGAGRLDRVKKGMWVTLGMGLVYTLITGALLLLGQDAIMRLFTQEEAVIAFGKAAMHWFCPFYFLLSILHGLAGAVRGTGASVPPMVVLLVSLCLFRIVWIQWVLPAFSTIDGNRLRYDVGKSPILDSAGVVYVTGSLFFGAVDEFNHRLQDIPEEDHLILSLRGMPSVDVSGAQAVLELCQRLLAKGHTIAFCGVAEDVRSYFDRAGVTALVGESAYYHSADRAILALLDEELLEA